MTPTERSACLAALEAAELATQALRMALGAEAPAEVDMVPLAAACRAWGVSKDAGLKRVRRGIGRKIAGRWHVPASAVPQRT